MKFLTNKRNIKIVSLILVLVTLSITIFPNYVYADNDAKKGGKLFRPIFQMLGFVGDLVMNGLQQYFLGEWDIKVEDEFIIKYSPAKIFSGDVPGLDANFIKPSTEKITIKDKKDAEQQYVYYTARLEWDEDDENVTNIYIDKIVTNKETVSLGRDLYNNFVSIQQVGTVSTDNQGKDIVYNGVTIKAAAETVVYEGKTYDVYYSTAVETSEHVNITTREFSSTSKELQGTIAAWYKTLRLIALVGLLSVLVYVGIRIIISSTGQEKAKYKKMIGDWLAAICILFVLHYIMALTMTTVDKLIDIFNMNNNIIGENGEDLLMSGIRQQIGTANSYSEIFVSLIIYLVLVVYTVIFTIHYLKRLVYLAFFTMIAPLIALTYPLDKIKDGQAQAFGMWIKEYIFNALLPVMHMLLYYIFVGSAKDFVLSNPIYALVCIGFLIPAEKFFKKMFGFDKATTSGQLGAAAGGAMVMNAINKIGNAGKEAQKKPDKAPKPTGLNGTDWNGPSLDSGSGNNNAGNNSGIPLTVTPQQNGGNNGQNSGPQTSSANPFSTDLDSDVSKEKFSFRSGIKEALKDRFNRPAIKGFAKKAGKKLYRGTGKAFGGAALGTLGLAAGIATGDLSNTAKYAGAGALAGGKFGDKTSGRIASVEKRTRDAFTKGGRGSKGHAERQAYVQLSNDREFLEACGIGGVSSDDRNKRQELVRHFIRNGVTDTDDIKQAYIANKKAKTNYTQDEMIQLARTANGISDSSWGDPESRDKILTKMYDELGYDKTNEVKKFIDFYKSR